MCSRKYRWISKFLFTLIVFGSWSQILQFGSAALCVCGCPSALCFLMDELPCYSHYLCLELTSVCYYLNLSAPRCLRSVRRHHPGRARSGERWGYVDKDLMQSMQTCGRR